MIGRSMEAAMPSVPDWISALSNMAVALAAGAAAVQGIRSLSAWRSETIGRRRLELAEEVIADFYEARDAFKWIRSPFASSAESEGRPGREEEHDRAVTQHRDSYYVPLKRMSDQAPLFSRLQARRYRVIATFGPEKAAPFDELRKIQSEVSATAQTLMEMRPSERPLDLDTREMRRVIYSVGPNDKIGQRLDTLVADVEGLFRPEISATARERAPPP
jgi:hypothetical protein